MRNGFFFNKRKFSFSFWEVFFFTKCPSQVPTYKGNWIYKCCSNLLGQITTINRVLGCDRLYKGFWFLGLAMKKPIPSESSSTRVFEDMGLLMPWPMGQTNPSRHEPTNLNFIQFLVAHRVQNARRYLRRRRRITRWSPAANFDLGWPFRSSMVAKGSASFVFAKVSKLSLFWFILVALFLFSGFDDWGFTIQWR